MNYILFDGTSRNNLLPFTYTRPVADIRIGILTIREKWEKLLDAKTSTLTKTYLQEKFPLINKADDILINASYLPTETLVEIVKNLKDNQAVYYQDEVVAVHTSDRQEEIKQQHYDKIEFTEELIQIKNTWDIFSLNEKALKADYELLTKGRKSGAIPVGVQVTNPDNVFIEESAEVNFCYLNATEGPIYIGKNAKILEGSMIRGSFALCEGSVVKMGAKIYGATTIGPRCTIGGEIKNVVFFKNSNKGHEGYLGNSVIGEWCNLGADTNNSNLKNNYAEVRLWSYETKGFVKTGLQFCGLMMGDHSKCGINTMFNTGTVVGVSANIFGDGFPRNFIPSYSWGGASGFSTYQMRKVKEVAQVVMSRRNLEFDAVEERILEHVFEITEEFRHY
ncbi:MAG TPA: glucose-1-phosphate thymidylyltransferase [Lutibacter sp.]|nr:glucose-1-phosphate thymidylyltransferase [Lutibacter sp.]